MSRPRAGEELYMDRQDRTSMAAVASMVLGNGTYLLWAPPLVMMVLGLSSGNASGATGGMRMGMYCGGLGGGITGVMAVCFGVAALVAFSNKECNRSSAMMAWAGIGLAVAPLLVWAGLTVVGAAMGSGQ